MIAHCIEKGIFFLNRTQMNPIIKIQNSKISAFGFQLLDLMYSCSEKVVMAATFTLWEVY